MKKIAEEIKKEYVFSTINKLKKFNGGIMNSNYSFFDENGKKYFVKYYDYYGSDKILESHKIIELLKPEIKTNHIVKTKKDKNLAIDNKYLMEVSEFIEDSKAIHSLSEMKEKHILEMAKKLAIFHKKTEKYISNLEFVDCFSLDEEFNMFKFIKNKIKGKSEFDKNCLVIIDLKLNQIKKYKSMKFDLQDLPKQVNHGDFLPQNCFFDSKCNFKYLIDFEHILYTYRIYDIVKTCLFLSRREEYEIPNSGEYDFSKIIFFLKEYMRNNLLINLELEMIPYLILFMSIKSDMVLYGHYVAKNNKVKDLMPKKDVLLYYAWWENHYTNLAKIIEEELYH